MRDLITKLLVLAAIMRPAAGRRVLCLHGSGGSASTFLSGGLAPLRSASPEWEFVAIDALSNGRWWTYPAGQRSFTADSYDGAEASIAAVESELATGNYRGLIGFSQGAMLAAIVAARDLLGESDSKLQFAVICGGAMPKPYDALMSRLREAPPSASMPTLHCLSGADSINPPALGEAVAGCFRHPAAELLWHDAGHQMPPTERLAEVVAFMDRHG